jgi:hypothetical protein
VLQSSDCARGLDDTLDRRADAAVAATFERLSESTLVEVQGVMDDYEARLGMIAIFAASLEDVPPEVWARFVRGTGILSTSSDAGIGYIEMVPAAEPLVVMAVTV